MKNRPTAPPSASEISGQSLQHAPVEFNRTVSETLAHDLALLLDAADAPCFALINAGQCASDYVPNLCSMYRLEAEPLFALTNEAEHIDCGPWLISLPAQPAPSLILALANEAGVKQALSLMATQVAPHRLVAHLRSWMNGLLEDGTSVLVRYFDPRVGQKLIELLPDQHRRQFMGAVHWWASWDQHYAPCLQSGLRQPIEAPLAAPLPISRDLQMQLDELNLAERLLALIVEEDIEAGELDNIAPGLQRLIARNQVVHAFAQGATSWSDLRIWVALGLRLHPGLAHHASGDSFLKKSIASGISLGEKISTISPEVIDRLRKDAPQGLAEISEKTLSPLRARRQVNPADHPFTKLS